MSIDAAVGLRISSWKQLEEFWIHFEQPIAGLEIVSRISRFSCNSQYYELFPLLPKEKKEENVN